MKKEEETLYKVLGVKTTATAKEIKLAYYKVPKYTSKYCHASKKMDVCKDFKKLERKKKR